MTQESRVAFEAWDIERGHPLSDIIPKYGPTSSMPQTERRFSDIAWEAWQASRKQALISAMTICEDMALNGMEEFLGARMTCADEIRSLMK
jgi:hypothetical protein